MYFDRRLFALMGGVRWRIALAAALGLISVPIAVWRLTLIGGTIARVFEGETLAAIADVLILIGVLLVLRAALQFGADTIAHGTAALVKTRLRRLIFEHILRLGPGHFDRRRSGEVAVTLVESVEQLDPYFGLYLPQLIVAAATPVVIFAFMAVLDLQLALLYFSCATLAIVAPLIVLRWDRPFYERWMGSYKTMGADFLDGVQGLPTLKAFGQSRSYGARLAERARRLYGDAMGIIFCSSITWSASIVCITLGSALALMWGAVRVRDGSLELRTLLIVLLLGVEVFRPLRMLLGTYHRGLTARAAAEGIFGLLGASPAVTDPIGSGQHATRPATPDGVAGRVAPSSPLDDPVAAVTFEHVSFGYEGGRRAALTDCSFTLHAGETLGVVGASGAGKSTIVNLLLRFADPQGGRVLVDGGDVRDLPLDAVRRRAAVVAQDTYLFHGTVAENLRLGKPDATVAELEEAARAANAHEFIAALPQGYDTIVGERGIRLSGGQRQRIAIARALLNDAPILVLDEALSSVDAENEAAIHEALVRLQQGRTTLVIAHRLSSVAGADRIIVLERGRIVESGTHAELLREGGVYARLMRAQQPVEEERASEAAAHATAGAADEGAPPEEEPPARAGAGALTRARVWARLVGLVGRDWWGLALTFVFGVLHAALIVAVGVVSVLLVGRVADGASLTPWLWLLPAVALLSVAFGWLEGWASHDFAFRVLVEVRIRLYRMLDPLAPGYVQRRRSGDLVSLVTGDVETFELFFAHSVAYIFVAALVPLIVLGVLATIAWPLALAVLPFLIAVALSPLIASGSMERLARRVRERLGDVHAHAVDGVQGLWTLAAFGRGPARAAEIEANGRDLSRLQLRMLRDQSLQAVAIEVLTGLGGLAVLTAGAWLLTRGEIDRTAVPLATVLALSTFQPVSLMVVTLKQLVETAGAARRYFAVEDEPVLVRDGAGVSLSRPAGAGKGLSVTFERVSFRYDPAGPAALADVSFAIEAGQTVALVGRSGAGKTTAAHLLLRFWDPQQGRIAIGGRDLRDFELDELRRHVALVA